MMDPPTEPVRLRVYDLSMGLARQMSQQLVGQQFDLIPHTGIEVYGIEYFFGGGVQQLPPATVEATFGMKPVEVLELGKTAMPKEVFEEFLAEVSPRFTQATYNLFTHNCNNFTDEVAHFLTGDGIPRRIVDMPQQFLETPMGASMRPMFEGQATAMNARLRAAGSGDGGVAAAAAPAAIEMDPAAITAALGALAGVPADPPASVEPIA